MSSKNQLKIIPAMGLAVILLGCAGGNESPNAATPANANAGGRCPHEIKQEKCPFCNPQRVADEGFCGEHGVPEALCSQCRPYLRAAFRAKGDWCAEHDGPESQCVLCHPELREKVRPGEHGTRSTSAGAGSSPVQGNCEHSIAQAKCPFCTPSLIETEGFCREHNVAEALCAACRPYLETAFRARGDWCAEHDTPESQCVICNPDLEGRPGGAQG